MAETNETEDKDWFERQVRLAKKDIELWPLHMRLNSGEKAKIFFGYPIYVFKGAKEVFKRMGVVALNKEDAKLLIVRSCIASNPREDSRGWGAEGVEELPEDHFHKGSFVKDDRQNDSYSVCSREMNFIKKEGVVVCIDIPYDYYHVAIGQMVWAESKKGS